MSRDYLRLRNDLYCVEWGVKLYSLTRCSELSCDVQSKQDVNVLAQTRLYTRRKKNLNTSTEWRCYVRQTHKIKLHIL